jgi:hypothetical protein
MIVAVRDNKIQVVDEVALALMLLMLLLALFLS